MFILFFDHKSKQIHVCTCPCPIFKTPPPVVQTRFPVVRTRFSVVQTRCRVVQTVVQTRVSVVQTSGSVFQTSAPARTDLSVALFRHAGFRSEKRVFPFFRPDFPLFRPAPPLFRPGRGVVQTPCGVFQTRVSVVQTRVPVVQTWAVGRGKKAGGCKISHGTLFFRPISLLRHCFSDEDKQKHAFLRIVRKVLQK